MTGFELICVLLTSQDPCSWGRMRFVMVFLIMTTVNCTLILTARLANHGNTFRYSRISKPNYDILHDLPPKSCDPPIVDISAQLYFLLGQGETQKAFSVWCLNTYQPKRWHSLWHWLFRLGTNAFSETMFPKQPNAQSFNLRARRIAQAMPRTRELFRTNLHLHQSQNTWKNLVKAVPSIQKPY